MKKKKIKWKKLISMAVCAAMLVSSADISAFPVYAAENQNYDEVLAVSEFAAEEEVFADEIILEDIDIVLEEEEIFAEPEILPEETPMEEVPIGEVPTDEAPMDEIPMDETPIEELPMEELPMEELPMEEVLLDSEVMQAEEQKSLAAGEIIRFDITKGTLTLSNGHWLQTDMNGISTEGVLAENVQIIISGNTGDRSETSYGIDIEDMSNFNLVFENLVIKRRVNLGEAVYNPAQIGAAIDIRNSSGEIKLYGNNAFRGSAASVYEGGMPAVYLLGSDVTFTGSGNLEIKGGDSHYQHNDNYYPQGGDAVQMNNSSLTFSHTGVTTAVGGNQEAQSKNNVCGIGIGLTGSTFSMTDGTLTAVGCVGLLVSEKSKLSISGGTVSSDSDLDGSLLVDSGSQAEIIGGTVNFPDGIKASGTTIIRGGANTRVTLSNGNPYSKTILAGTVTVDADDGWYAKVTDTKAENRYVTSTGIKKLNGTSTIQFEKNSREYQVTLEQTAEDAKGAGSYLPGEQVTISCGTKANYTFDHWEASGVSLQNKTAKETSFSMPFGNVSVKAVWKRSCSITIENGSKDPVEEVYLTGESVTLTADDRTAENLLFDHWTIVNAEGDGEIQDEKSPATVFTAGENDTVIRAEYVQGYRVTVTGGSAAGTGVYRAGENISIKAKIPANHVFNIWSQASSSTAQGGEGFGTFLNPTEAETVFIVGAENTELTANFAAKKEDTFSQLGDFVLSGGKEGTNYSFSGDQLKIYGDGTYRVQMREGITSTSHRIWIDTTKGSPSVILDNISIGNLTCASNQKNGALTVNPSAGKTVTLLLEGENRLSSSSAWHCALRKLGDGTLIITSTQGDGSTSGKLSAENRGDYGAAIGSCMEESVKNLEIRGGSIYASTSGRGAAIGSGGHTWKQIDESAAIVISGGYVEAKSYYGAGIGGYGTNRTDGGRGGVQLTINGGELVAETVYKSGKAPGMAIGTGSAAKADQVLPPISITVNGKPSILHGNSADDTAAVDASAVASGTACYAHISYYKTNPPTSVKFDVDTAEGWTGSSIKLNAMVIGADKTLEYSVSGNTSTETSISKTGVLHIAEDETADKLSVTAASAANPYISRTIAVTVKKAAVTIDAVDADGNAVVMPDVYYGTKIKLNIKTTAAGTVRVYIDGKTVSGKLTPTGGLYTFSVNPGLLPEGEHTLQAVFTGENEAFVVSSNTLTAKVVCREPVVEAWPSVGMITYGQKLSDAVLSGGKADTEGTFAWENGDQILEAGTHTELKMIFQPDSPYWKMSSNENISITVQKAVPEIKWPVKQQTFAYTGAPAMMDEVSVILKNGEVFGSDSAGGTVVYSYRKQQNTEDSFTNGIPTNAGIYEIMAEVHMPDGNYEGITKTDSTMLLTIEKVQPSLTLADAYMTTKMYDGIVLPVPAAEELEETSIDLTYQDIVFTWYKQMNQNVELKLAQAPKNAGTYLLKMSLNETDNEEAAELIRKVQISQKPITITASDQTIQYGDTIAAGQDHVVCEDLAYGDFLGDITLTASTDQLTDSGKITPSDAVLLTAADAPASGETSIVTENYSITYVEGNLTIQRAVMSDFPKDLYAAETISGKNDGSIKGLTTAMEISTDQISWTPVTDPDMSFAPGTYYIRYIEDENHDASGVAKVVIGSGRMLRVTFKAEGSADIVKEVVWKGSLTAAQIPAIPAREGYDQTAPYWDKTIQELTGIEKDMVVRAVYTANPKEDTPVLNTSHAMRLAGKAYSKKVKLTWNKIPEADGYVIYGAKCGEDQKALKTITKSSKTSWTKKKLKSADSYEFMVRPYVLVNGEKCFIGKSNTVHLVTTGGRYTNIKKVKAAKTSVKLKKGKTTTIRTKLTLASSGKAVIKHMKKLSYASDNVKVAKVTAKGKIKAVGKGTCYIYVTAPSGAYTKVKVKVK